jgi:hypothetical protein
MRDSLTQRIGPDWDKLNSIHQKNLWTEWKDFENPTNLWNPEDRE